MGQPVNVQFKRSSTESNDKVNISDGQILFDKDGYIAWDSVDAEGNTIRTLVRAAALGTDTLGSKTVPIYLNNGKPTPGLDLSNAIGSKDVNLSNPLTRPMMMLIPVPSKEDEGKSLKVISGVPVWA